MVAAVVAVLVLGGAGKYAWAATEVRRVCPLQAGDMQQMVPWPVISTTVFHGTDQVPFTECDYSDTYSGPYTRHVAVAVGATEAGAAPGQAQTCLKGGYWGGRGLLCVDPGKPAYASGLPDVGPSGTSQPDMTTGDISATRLNGDDTVTVTVRCNDAPSPDGRLRRDMVQTCLSQASAVMTAVLDRRGVQGDPGVTPTPVDLDAALAAGAGTSGTEGGTATEDSSGTASSPTDTGTAGSVPTDGSTDPAASAPQPGASTTPDLTSDPTPSAPPADPKLTLDQLAAEGEASLSLDGHWAIQLASKFDGITDKAQSTTSGSHTFHYADILEEFQQLQAAHPNEQVVLIRGSTFSTIKRNAKIYVTVLDVGGLSSRADVLTWCQEHFSQRGDALLNVCYPRQLKLD